MLLSVSRPRFWIYLLGPALLGSVAALTSGGHWSWLGAFALLVFTFPANLFLYGINDIFDIETDRLNPKKQGYEKTLNPKHAQHIIRWSILGLLPFLIAFLLLPFSAILSVVLFLLLGAFYSAPPIRAKARPFLDALFNILYLFPGLTAWYTFGGGRLNVGLVFAAACWCMAMHAYSAVPDIEADRTAHLSTIATTLGKTKTLMVCAGLYALSALFIYPVFGWPALVLGIVYIVLMGVSSRAQNQKLLKIYTFFPWLNTLVGMLLFLIILARAW
ncbi:prenyltransferase [Patescibacteria group bacterium]|nr:prenyltransferase [Patescibacteria group bacterium]